MHAHSSFMTLVLGFFISFVMHVQAQVVRNFPTQNYRSENLLPATSAPKSRLTAIEQFAVKRAWKDFMANPTADGAKAVEQLAQEIDANLGESITPFIESLPGHSEKEIQKAWLLFTTTYLKDQHIFGYVYKDPQRASGYIVNLFKYESESNRPLTKTVSIRVFYGRSIPNQPFTANYDDVFTTALPADNVLLVDLNRFSHYSQRWQDALAVLPRTDPHVKISREQRDKYLMNTAIVYELARLYKRAANIQFSSGRFFGVPENIWGKLSPAVQMAVEDHMFGSLLQIAISRESTYSNVAGLKGFLFSLDSKDPFYWGSQATLRLLAKPTKPLEKWSTEGNVNQLFLDVIAKEGKLPDIAKSVLEKGASAPIDFERFTQIDPPIPTSDDTISPPEQEHAHAFVLFVPSRLKNNPRQRHALGTSS